MSPRPPAPGSLAPGLPLPRRPAPRRLLITLALAVLFIAAAVPAVSADDIINEHLIEYEDTSLLDVLQPTYTVTGGTLRALDGIYIQNIQRYSDVSYISVDVAGNKKAEGVYNVPYTIAGRPDTATIYVVHYKNFLGTVTKTRFTVFPNNWDVSGLSGTQTISFSDFTFYTDTVRDDEHTRPSIGLAYKGLSVATKGNRASVSITAVKIWENYLVVSEDALTYTTNIIRNIDGTGYSSEITFKKVDEEEVFKNADNVDKMFIFNKNQIDNILVNSGVNTYTFPITNNVPISDNASVTVYVQNSQTGALLADARLSILASAGGTETEIINTTLPGGTATYTLQPTGGGSPNPDYYRAVATVPGYTQIIDNHSFTLNGPHDVIIEMRPDTGGPLDPDRAYLEFYVRDIHANPVSSASVQCDGRIKTTNSQGYAVFEVSKNATYPYVAKKSGYVTIEGTATVADGPRYVANVVLGPGTVPTYPPTLGPGETPGATPTPDTRTNEQKGQAIIDLIADFAEPIAILAILATIFGLMKMMTPGRR